VNNFAQNAASAAGGVIGGAAGNGFVQGVGGIIGGAAEGLIGAAAAPFAAAAGVAAGSMASNFTSNIDVPMISVRERPNDRRDRNVPMRQAAQTKIQEMHNRGQGPAAFVDIRTINGQNHLKPKDKRLRTQTNYSYGGSTSSTGNNPAGFSIAPSAPPIDPDVPPMAAQSYTDLSSQVKKAPIISTTFKKPRRVRDSKPEKPVLRNNKRKRIDDVVDPNPFRRKQPFKTGTKRAREIEDEDQNPFVRRPPPKPEGRLN
jgi:hypothetical protein